MNLGLIAGGGDLPKFVTRAASEEGYVVTTIGLKGFANPDDYSGAKFLKIAEFGKIVKGLKKSKCTHVCFAGIVKRPDFKSLKPDLKAMLHMPGALKAARKGDDALMRYLLTLFEKEGFEIIAPQDLCQSLLVRDGILTDIPIANDHKADVLKACKIAKEMGRLDIGQGAVVADGIVLAVEAQEGTDFMLARIADELPSEIKGDTLKRKGVLAKMLKPQQDSRVDLPTIGPKTIELASQACLAGIVVEADQAFIFDRAKTIELANEAGLFIAGLPPSKT